MDCGEEWVVGDGGAGGCCLRNQNVSGLWLNVEEETSASNDWIGCTFKPFKGHTYIYDGH